MENSSGWNSDNGRDTTLGQEVCKQMETKMSQLCEEGKTRKMFAGYRAILLSVSFPGFLLRSDVCLMDFLISVFALSIHLFRGRQCVIWNQPVDTD